MSHGRWSGWPTISWPTGRAWRQDLVTQVMPACVCGWMDTIGYRPGVDEQTVARAWRTEHWDELSRRALLEALVGCGLVRRGDGRRAVIRQVDGSRVRLDIAAGPRDGQPGERDGRFLADVLGPERHRVATGVWVQVSELGQLFLPDDGAAPRRLPEQPFRLSWAPHVPDPARRCIAPDLACAPGRGWTVAAYLWIAVCVIAFVTIGAAWDGSPAEVVLAATGAGLGCMAVGVVLAVVAAGTSAAVSLGRARHNRRRYAGRYVTRYELAELAAAEPDLGALAGRVQNAADLLRLRRAWREGWLDHIPPGRPTRTPHHRLPGAGRMLDNYDTAMRLLDQQAAAEVRALRHHPQIQPTSGLDGAEAGLQAVIDQLRQHSFSVGRGAS
jgi:hypothetical protein